VGGSPTALRHLKHHVETEMVAYEAKTGCWWPCCPGFTGPSKRRKPAGQGWSLAIDRPPV